MLLSHSVALPPTQGRWRAGLALHGLAIQSRYHRRRVGGELSGSARDDSIGLGLLIAG